MNDPLKRLRNSQQLGEMSIVHVYKTPIYRCLRNLSHLSIHIFTLQIKRNMDKSKKLWSPVVALLF